MLNAMKTVLETDNGLCISSGQEGVAILSLRLTRAVNSGEELTLGSVCASVAELQLITDGECPIKKEDRFRLYKEDPFGRRWPLGVFTAEKPRWDSAHRVNITAYDNVVKLDRDLSQAFHQLTGWPLPAGFLLEWACDQCGVELAEPLLAYNSRPIQPFSADGITGRQLLSFFAEMAGQFGYADENGKIAFGWYAPNEKVSIGPSFQYGIQTDYADNHLKMTGVLAFSHAGELMMDVADYYDDGLGNVHISGADVLGGLAGKMSVADYQILPFDGIQFRQDTADVGICQGGDENIYRITGNPFLVFGEDDPVSPIIEPMQMQLGQVSYTPMTLTVPYHVGVRTGDILAVRDKDGREHTCYVMEQQITGHTMTIRCTGTGQRDAAPMVSSTIRNLGGKVMHLQADVEGLFAENADTKGNLAALSLTVSGIEGKVASLDGVQESVSTLRQDAKSLELELRTIRENGTDKVVTSTGYSFSDEGLRIKKSGQEMENLLDHTGMTVSRGGNAILQADHRGVTAVDVTVGNFLAVAHARFEQYENGTACFYI